ncbi:20497_t:CDS:1, partial [Gigaspora rosea]
GFAKIKVCLEFEALRKLINDVKTNLLQKLPDTPDGIDRQIRNALPFTLPLEDRRQIQVVAITLHQVFKFDLLPEAYIANKRIPLPAHPDDLNDETRNIFPITTR